MLPHPHRQVAAPHNNALKLTAHGCVRVGCGAPQLSAVLGRHRGGEVKHASLIAVSVILVTLVARAAAPDPLAASEIGQIQQLLVETILAQRPAWHGYSTKTFCIVLGRLEWKDGLLVPPEGPSEPFLSRIAPKGMTVLPARGCQMVSMGIDNPGVVTHSDQKAAFFITVGAVVQTSPSTAEVHAGFICGAMCASTVTYVLEKPQSEWIVIDTKGRIIS
jgi:hypothetical protein